MKVNEIKETKTIEEVVRVEYIAEDGQVFRSEEECQKYEKTCKCVIMSAYKPLVKGTISEYGLYEECGCEDFYYDLVEIKNENDREIVNKALKFAYENARLVTEEEIGKTIMVAKEYDDLLTGYHTTIDNIINTIKGNYENELNKEVE